MDAVGEIPCHSLCFVAIPNDVGRNQDDQFGPLALVLLDAKQTAQHGHVHQKGHAVADALDPFVNNAAEQHGLAVLHHHRGLGFARGEAGRAGIAERGVPDIADFLANLHIDQAGRVDLGQDGQDRAGIPVLDAGHDVGGRQGALLGGGQNRHLFADQDMRLAVIRGNHMRCRQDVDF